MLFFLQKELLKKGAEYLCCCCETSLELEVVPEQCMAMLGARASP